MEKASHASELQSRMSVALARIAPDLALVEAALRDQLESKADLIGVLGSHLLSSGGKRLRPALQPSDRIQTCHP